MSWDWRDDCMPVRQFERVTVTRILALRGKGTEDDMYRNVTIWFEDDGTLIAYDDPAPAQNQDTEGRGVSHEQQLGVLSEALGRTITGFAWRENQGASGHWRDDEPCELFLDDGTRLVFQASGWHDSGGLSVERTHNTKSRPDA